MCAVFLLLAGLGPDPQTSDPTPLNPTQPLTPQRLSNSLINAKVPKKHFRYLAPSPISTADFEQLPLSK